MLPVHETWTRIPRFHRWFRCRDVIGAVCNAYWIEIRPTKAGFQAEIGRESSRGTSPCELSVDGLPSEDEAKRAAVALVLSELEKIKTFAEQLKTMPVSED